MTAPASKNGDALYTVILRAPDAKNQLTNWSNTSRSIHARVEDNRMHIFNQNTLSLFMVTWTHGWDNMVIWDTWTKRHISL
jgi:hypothetical protein